MRKLAGLAILAGSLMAAPRLVTVQDTLYKADGTKFNGVILIDWRSFMTSDNSTVPTQSLVVPVTDGVLRVLLTPTTTAQGTAYYDVRYNSDGRVLFVEKWNVPPSTSVLTLRDVRASEGGTTPPGLSTILISDVIGLEDELSVRPSKDTSFASGRVVVSTSSGTIGSAFGSTADCVRVDGTSTPCAEATVFADGEIPAGSLNGVNAVFTLVATPNPAASLALFRNGIIQKQNTDYSLAGNTITFIPAATPQTGDILLANYRSVAGTSAGLMAQSLTTARSLGADATPVAHTNGDQWFNSEVQSIVGYQGSQSHTTPQIICSVAGEATSGIMPVMLGSCTIPAALIQPGDRFEIHYGYSHTGGTSGFTAQAKWGSTSLLNRTATASDNAVVGKSDIAISSGSAVWSTLSWGSAMAFAASAGTAGEPTTNGVVVGIYGQMTAATQDTLSLNGVTVVRYPGQSNP